MPGRPLSPSALAGVYAQVAARLPTAVCLTALGRCSVLLEGLVVAVVRVLGPAVAAVRVLGPAVAAVRLQPAALPLPVLKHTR